MEINRAEQIGVLFNPIEINEKEGIPDTNGKEKTGMYIPRLLSNDRKFLHTGRSS